MSPAESLLWERWEDVDRLLNEALDLPADARVDHVRRGAAGDGPLGDLVIRLLSRVENDAGVELAPREEVVLSAFSGGEPESGIDELADGATVGRYRIVGRIGRGGMATVYEAERADGAYQQRVALKVLRRGLDTDDLVQRFLAERQILSSLSHPNIGRLLDGGATPSGRPFLVMELVRGESITAWADSHRVDVAGRLRLFLSVADAVNAAHRQLVVHRDIKPSNILVGDDGRVKLVDFGIAKLLEGDDVHTEAGARALTPDYASPEQLQGAPITTATDVYQLGLLLRELLTGLRPRAGGTDPGATPLRGELDIIVGKALRTDPAERYRSVEEFAGDVERYLNGRPITAHPESVAYQFRKFAGRHPFFVPGVVAAQLAVLGFIVVLGAQNRRIAQERDAAEVASRRALATQAFLVDLLRSPDPTAGQAQESNLTVADALQRGRARISGELEQQPEVKAAVLEAMGRSFTGLGRFETADTLLREALDLQRKLHGPNGAPLASVAFALGENYRRERNFAAADEWLHEGLRLRTASGQVTDSALAGVLASLGGVRRDLGDVDSAIVLSARAVAVHRAAGDTASDTYTRVLGQLAYVLRGAERLDSAEVVYREVLRRQEVRSTPYDRSITHNNLGYLLRLKKDYAGAERSYREALRLAGETMSAGHPTMLTIRNNLAGVLELAGKLDDVVAVGREQIAAAEREWPGGHWRVGSAHLAIGRFLLRKARAAEALPYLQGGVRSYIATIGGEHTWTAAALADLGAAYLIAGRSSDGTRHLDRASALLQRRTAQFDADTRLYLTRTADVLETSGHPERAVRLRRLLEAS